MAISLPDARITAMAQTIEDLRGLWSQVATKVDLSEGGANVVLFDNEGNRLGQADVDAIVESLKIARQAIGILNGTTKTAKWGNLFDRASVDDDAFKFWCEYAQSTGDSLNRALNLGKYNVAKFFSRVGSNIADIAQNAADGVSDSFPWLVVALVAVVLILVLK